ncbi:MAG: chlorophyll a/b-binding protein [Cyanobacteria bacterium P01_A01_bin.83]
MENQENKFGFTKFAEDWNGRLAMIGFVAAMAVEYFTGQGILGQLGIM